jgi:sarcosine oxidase
MESTEYAVVGAGLSGAATAWHLAARGHDVALLERSTPANDAGSSHGSARIFRYAYPEEFYTGLVQEAKAGWDELARLSGKQLITPTGAVDYGAIRQTGTPGRRAGSTRHRPRTSQPGRSPPPVAPNRL